MMIQFKRMYPLAFSFFALTLFTTFGCKSAGGRAAPASRTPDNAARLQRAAPRTCSKVTSPPSAALAAILVQCAMDAQSYTGLGLIQDVKLEMGSSRPFVYYTDAGLAGIDLNAKVYELRGSYTGYFCTLVSASLNGPGKNCIKSAVPKAQGGAGRPPSATGVASCKAVLQTW